MEILVEEKENLPQGGFLYIAALAAEKVTTMNIKNMTITKLPFVFKWFLEEEMTTFTPWHFHDTNFSVANDRFKIETITNKEVYTFAHRQDEDTFAGFEVIAGVITDRVIVFHPSFGENIKGWDIIKSEHNTLFEFLKDVVLPDMQEWVQNGQE